MHKLHCDILTFFVNSRPCEAYRAIEFLINCSGVKLRKTVLVIGASSGAGLATANQFYREGWNVVATVRDFSAVRINRTATYRSLVKVLDVTDHDMVTTTIEDAEILFGKIDVVVNNAAYGQYGLFEALTDTDLRESFETNFFGAANVLREIIPRMRARRDGTIVNISACEAFFGVPTKSAYVSTKWALEGLCESLWHEVLPFGVKIKVIQPNTLATPFEDRAAGRSKRFGTLTEYTSIYETFQKGLAAMYRAPTEAELFANHVYSAATDGRNNFRYFAGPAFQWVKEAKSRMQDDQFESIMRQLFREPEITQAMETRISTPHLLSTESAYNADSDT